MEIRKGYKKTAVGVIPQDWECVELGECVDYIKGFAFKSKDYSKNGIRIIRVSDTTFDSIKDDTAVYIDSLRYKEFVNWKLYEDDIVLSTVGSKPPMFDSLVGKAILISRKYAGSLLNQNAVVLRTKGVNQKIIYANLKRPNYIKHIEMIFRGNANQASITLKDLFKFNFALPIDTQEQQAIANALSDIDGLISSLTKLIEKKKSIKQGMMQELLTGNKRLDGFSENWIETALGSIAKINTGKKNNEDKVDSGMYPFFVRSNKVERIDTYSFDGEAIIVPGEGDIGEIFHYINGKFDYHQRVYKISGFSKEIYAKYIYFYMVKYFGDYALKNTVKATVDSLRLPTFQVFIVKLPPTLAEQTAIATVLSDMDNEIETLQNRLNKCRNIKQGVMQKLLTGIIRLDGEVLQ